MLKPLCFVELRFKHLLETRVFKFFELKNQLVHFVQHVPIFKAKVCYSNFIFALKKADALVVTMMVMMCHRNSTSVMHHASVLETNLPCGGSGRMSTAMEV